MVYGSAEAQTTTTHTVSHYGKKKCHAAVAVDRSCAYKNGGDVVMPLANHKSSWAKNELGTEMTR
ncbi:hypothetical protein SESBI_43801 [Sesbania bispinosa]|nr:hypothetical protein SESBI_43801 [Sesbania bispinosa]